MSFRKKGTVLAVLADLNRSAVTEKIFIYDSELFCKYLDYLYLKYNYIGHVNYQYKSLYNSLA